MMKTPMFVTPVIVVALSLCLAASITMGQNTTETIVIETTFTELNSTTGDQFPQFSNDTIVAYTDMDYQIRKILKFYQESDLAEFPGALVPDPLIILPTKLNLNIVHLEIFNMEVNGLSKLSVKQFRMDFNNLKVIGLIKFYGVHVLGQYFLQSWIDKSTPKPFNVTLTDLDVYIKVSIIQNGDDNMKAVKTEINIRFKDCALRLSSLDGLGTYVPQNAFNAACPLMYRDVRSVVLGEIANFTNSTINKTAKALFGLLPKHGASLPGTVVLDVQAYLRRAGLDPYYATVDQHFRVSLVDVTVTEWAVSGLSNIRAVDGVVLELIDGPALQASGSVTMGPVNGSFSWSYRMPIFGFVRSGVSCFNATSITVHATARQLLNVRDTTVLDSMRIDTANVTASTDCQDTAPGDFISSQLHDSVQEDLQHHAKQVVQTALNNFRVGKAIEDVLDTLDRRMAQGAGVH